MPSDNILVASLCDTLSQQQEEFPANINFFGAIVLSIYLLRAVLCWAQEKCQYNPLDDLEVLLLANIHLTWGHDTNILIDYFSSPRSLMRNYNRKILVSILALAMQIYGSYQVQQQIGNMLVNAQTPPLSAQAIVCCTMEAYSMACMALNLRFRLMEDTQPVAPLLLFRQFTGQHDNSSDDGFDFSNPNTPSVSPGNTPTAPKIY